MQRQQLQNNRKESPCDEPEVVLCRRAVPQIAQGPSGGLELSPGGALKVCFSPQTKPAYLQRGAPRDLRAACRTQARHSRPRATRGRSSPAQGQPSPASRGARPFLPAPACGFPPGVGFARLPSCGRGACCSAAGTHAHPGRFCHWSSKPVIVMDGNSWI